MRCGQLRGGWTRAGIARDVTSERGAGVIVEAKSRHSKSAKHPMRAGALPYYPWKAKRSERRSRIKTYSPGGLSGSGTVHSSPVSIRAVIRSRFSVYVASFGSEPSAAIRDALA